MCDEATWILSISFMIDDIRRPVVCDSEGTILWIPGLARSFHAPVTGKTRSVVSLRLTT
jgi:hypothetical protein